MKFHPKRTRIKRVRPVSNARRSFLFTKPATQKTVEAPQPVDGPTKVLAVGQPEPQTVEPVVTEEPIQEEVTAVADDTVNTEEPTEDVVAKPKKARTKRNKTPDHPIEQPEAVNDEDNIPNE